MGGPFALLHNSDVRVDDDLMDQSEPEGQSPEVQPEAVLDMDTHDAAVPAEREYRVGDHLCTITNGGVCMTCKHCRRYVTSYQGTCMAKLGHVVEATVQAEKAQESLPIVVYEGVQLCGLGCGSSVCAQHTHRRTIREQIVTVCVDCINAHPKQLLKSTSEEPCSAAVPCITIDGEKCRRVCSPPRRNAGEGTQCADLR
eukprot:3374265-Amphidinium_carterae.1